MLDILFTKFMTNVIHLIISSWFFLSEMETFEVFNIAFSTQPPVYYPGQPVTGYFNLNLKKDMKVRNIRIEMAGKAFVSLENQFELKKL